MLHSQIITRNVYLSTMILIYIAYPLLLMKTLSIFPCFELGDNGDFFLYEEMDTECYTSIHNFLMWVVGTPSLILWCIGLPTCLFIRLSMNRKKLSSEMYMEYYGFIYDGLKPKFFFFEFILLLKKLLLVFSFKLMHSYFLMYKTLVALFLNIFQTEFQKSWNVYSEDHLNDIHTLSNYSI